MAFEFKLPELGENIEKAEIVKILVSVGDKVKVDQVLFEIETDKATVEVPSETEGIVKSINFKEGDTVKVGDIIFILEDYNEKAVDEKKTDENSKVNKDKKVTKEETERVKDINTIQNKLFEFKLPELGENIESTEITKVLVSVGDKISKDSVLFEIETDKATVEVPSEISGIVKEVKIKAGEKVSVGETVIIIENVEQLQDINTAKLRTERQPQTEVENKTATGDQEKISITSPKLESSTSAVSLPKIDVNKIVPASPTVRRFAREIGIDINLVVGSGPSGRISIEDVKAFSKSFNEKIASGTEGITFGVKHEPLPDFTKWGSIKKESMTNIRKKTAEHLSFTWSVIPHVTQFDKADITVLEEARKQYSKQSEEFGGKLTITAILLKICASALKKFPQFNSSLDMQKKEIIYKEYFNIGIAVDTEKGLIVPVVKNVDKKNIFQLAKELSEISIKARDNKITIEDMQGGCFTISNLGGIGGTYFTPIVNSPEVAILGVSRGNFEHVYKNGEFVPRLMLPLSLSYDHRIIDGADAARFIRWISNALEQPFLLSLEG